MNQDQEQERVKQSEETVTYQHSDKPVEGDEQDIDQDLAQRQAADRANEENANSPTETAQSQMVHGSNHTRTSSIQLVAPRSRA